MASSLNFSFDYDDSLADFTVSKAAYLAAHPDAGFGYIATSSLVVDTRSARGPRLLLLQRAASDDDPNLWEPPGGACDDDDPSILHAAARELREEAGLEALKFVAQVGDPHFFTLDDGKRVAQFCFAVQIQTDDTDDSVTPAVTLSPSEHQQFVWATEAEVLAKRMDGGVCLEFTRNEVQKGACIVFDVLRTRKVL